MWFISNANFNGSRSIESKNVKIVRSYTRKLLNIEFQNKIINNKILT